MVCSQQDVLKTHKRAWRRGARPSQKHRDWNDLFDDTSGSMKSAQELRRLYQILNVDTDEEIILLCNTGYGSTYAHLALL